MKKRWICRKCGYVQGENYDLYHRCAECGSIDLEEITLDDNMGIENHRLVVYQ
jgi:predicted Zn-ribbon and HTH transcriptional regulator